MSFVLKRFKNSIVAEIERLLEANGPMTRAEFSDAGVSKESIGSVLTRLSNEGPRSPQRIHVHDWTHDHDGARCYPRAIYALGPGVNKPKPKPMSARARAKKYQRKAKLTVASVFELGTHVKHRIATTRQRRDVARSITNGESHADR